MGFYILSFLFVFFFVWFTRRNYILFFLLIVFLIFVIGFRYQVGCDWESYLYIYEYDDSFEELFPPLKDFLYDFINYIAHKLDLGIYFVNTFVATILVLGVFFYSKTKKYYPYLIIYSIPYLFFVIGMGYTRQALALGFIFFAVLYLERRKEFIGFLNYILAFLSHKTSIVFIALYAFQRLKLIYMLIFLILTVIFLMSYKTHIELFIRGYIEAHMQSSGFIARFLQALVFITPFLVLSRREINPKSPLFSFVVLYLSTIPLWLITKSTTVSDRFLLYTYPLQLYAIDFILRKFKGNILIKFTVIAISFLTLIVWFQFAHHRSCWIPYRNILFNT